MNSKIFTLVLILMGMFSCGLVLGQGISVDHVDGSPGPGMVDAGTDVVFHIRMTAGDNSYGGITNGFRVYSPDGAEWNTTTADTTGAIGKAQFDLMWVINNYSITGSGADTVGFAGVVMFGSGMPAEFDSVTHTITIGPIDPIYEGHTICLDSSYFPPQGYWMWTTSDAITVFPTWDGPHCYTVVADVEPPDIAVSPDSLDQSLYTGETATQLLTIENTGPGDLFFDVSLGIPDVLAVHDEAQDTVTRTITIDPPVLTDVNSFDASGFIPTRMVTEKALDYNILTIDLGINENYEALDLLGIPYTMVSPADFYSVNLLDYDVLYVGWTEGATSSGMQALFDRSADIGVFLASGRGLVALSEYGYNELDWQWLPFSVDFVTGHSDMVSIVNSDHPIMEGLTDADLSNWGNSVHNAFTSFPPELEVLAVRSDDSTAVDLAGFYGAGRVFLSGQDPDFHFVYGAEPGAAILLENALNWAGSGVGWLTVTPTSGMVPSGGTLDLEATFDATGMNGGDYFADIHILSNDPDEDTVTVPAHLHVDGAPDIVVTPDSLDYGLVFIGGTVMNTVLVSNDGTDSLLVSDISSDNPLFTANITSFGLAPGENQIVEVTFAPTSVGLFTGTLTITSNDPDEPTVGVYLEGEGALPPDIWVAPTFFDDTLFTGETSSHWLTIGNDGYSDLEFNIVVMNADLTKVRLNMPERPRPTAPFGIPDGVEYVPDRVIVKLRTDAKSGAVTDLKESLKASVLKEFTFIDAELWSISGISVSDAVTSYRDDPSIEYIEPDYILNIIGMPNDPRFDELWGMHNVGQTGGSEDADIDAPEAWDRHTGGSVVIGVIDTGVDYNHEDLVGNIWVNEGEIPDNGIDDDGNGYIDDIHGWDFVNNDNDPMDDHSHGTHCSGTIAGVGNNGIGVAGVCWSAKIMALKFLNSGGSGTTTDAILAVEYATANGANLTSNSWGGGGYSDALYDAINAAGAANQLFIAAAGNYGDNTDLYPHYPSSYDLDNIIAVAATDHNDGLAGFSNYGATSVDLGAPGVDILSCIPGNTYGYKNGTSMATPHVSGVAGLIWSGSPILSNLDVKEAIMDNIDMIPSMAGKCVTGGRLNVNQALENLVWWVNLDTLQGVVPAGLSLDIEVTFDATGMNGGDYNANILINSNDFDEGMVTVPAHLHVDGAPDIVETPDSLDYGLVFIGGTAMNTVLVSNDGTDSLFVSDISSDNALFTANITSFGLASDESQVVEVTFSPTSVGLFTGMLTITSNDPDEPTVGVYLEGEGALPPDIAVSPDSFDDTLFTGETSTHYLTISNVGDSELEFDIAIEGVDALSVTTSAVLGDDDRDLAGRNIGFKESTLRSMALLANSSYSGLTWQDWSEYSQTLPMYQRPQESPVTIMGSKAVLPVVIEDPAGDGFTTDITFLRGASISGMIQIEMEFFTVIDPYAIGGFLSLDIDQDSSTGVLPSFGIPEQNIGVEYEFQLFSVGSGYVELYDVVSFTLVGTYPVDVGTYTLSFSAPLFDLGDDDGSMDVTGVVGDSGPTDWFPDIGHGTIGGCDWVAVDISTGTVPPGSSVDVTVTFDATGMNGGDYNANILINSNDPDEDTVPVPAHLHVDGAPDIVETPDSLDFGLVFIGGTAMNTVLVSNEGTDSLFVSDISSDNALFTANITSFGLAPGENQIVEVTFTPTSVGLFTGTLTITSNDPDEPTVGVYLEGEGALPPDIAVSPDSFDDTLFTGETSIHYLTISNDGYSDLDYEIDVERLDAKVSVSAVMDHTVTPREGDWLPASESGTRGAQKILGDVLPVSSTGVGSTLATSIDVLILSNYQYDNDWIATNYAANMSDIVFSTFDCYSVIPDLAYLQSFDVVLLFENGCYSNSAGVGDRLYEYVVTGGNLVIGTFYWQGRSDGGFGGTYSNLELIDPLYGGSCRYMTESLGSVLNHPLTNGIMNLTTYFRGGPNTLRDNATAVAWWADGDILLAFNQPGGTITAVTAFPAEPVYSVVDGDFFLLWENALKWTANAGVNWLSTEPVSGTVPPGSSVDVTVTFDATGMNGGDYFADIHILSNDPDEDTVTVPAHLHVDGAPDIVVTPDSLDYGLVFIGGTVMNTVLVSNDGTDSLLVSDISSDNPLFTANITSFGLAPGENQIVEVTFAPTSVGLFTGTLTITSNDPDEPTVGVYLEGEGALPPDIWVAPTFFDDTLFTGETSSHWLTIGNDGYSDLEFNIVVMNADLTKVRLNMPERPRPTAPFGIPDGVEYVPDRVIVKLRTDAKSGAVTDLKESLKASVLKEFTFIDAELWSISGISVSDAVTSYRDDPSIEYIEPDYILNIIGMPNDPRFDELWGMHNVGQTGGSEDADIDAPEAWDRHTGGSVVIGVIDTGVDYNHEDLVGNIWVNEGEIPDNGIDDDGNGYIDDIHGWDFVNNDNNPMDDHSHGTHCSGTIAGVGNNGIGVAGVCWSAKIMALKFLNSGGSGTTTDAILAVEYATANGANLTSNSWGGGGYSDALYDAIDAAGAANQLFIAAAGNGYGNDNDLYPHYPSSYNLDNIISVAATDHNDGLAGFSNYGATSVDLGAPGVDILSCIPGNTYGYKNGTSMAIPHVSGVAGLIWSGSPILSNLDVKEAIMDNVDMIPSMAGKCVTGGRLNVNQALENLVWWVNLDTLEGVVPAGLSMDIEVTFDATGMNGDDYNANILINSNDPDEDTVTVPAHLHVIGAPVIVVTPDSLDLGTVFVTDSVTQTLLVSNEGTDFLLVSDISSDNILFTANITTFGLAPGENQIVEVTFAPTSVGLFTGTLTITSNDSIKPVVTVYLEGEAVEPPDIVVTPDLFNDTLFTGGMSTHWLTIANEGFSDLEFSISTAEAVPAAVSARVRSTGLSSSGVEPGFYADESRERTSSVEFPHEFPNLESNGVLDMGDVLGIYQNMPSSNDGIVWVNDYLYIVDYFAYSVAVYDTTTESVIHTFPVHMEPYGITWDGQYLWIGDYVGNIYGYELDGTLMASFSCPTSEYSAITWDGEYFIVNQAFDYNPTFHRVDYTGSIVESFTSTFDGDATATVWVPEHGTLWVNNPWYGRVLQLSLEGGAATLISEFPFADDDYSYSLTHNGTDLWWSDWQGPLYQIDDGIEEGISWLTFDVTSGTVPAGFSMDIEVTFDATGMNGGDDSANILIISNDPDEDTVTVPAHLHVDGAPDIVVTPDSLDYGLVFIGGTVMNTVLVSNEGTDSLFVSDISSDNALFTANITSFGLAPDESQVVEVTFTPTSVGLFTGTLTITSNDPDEPTVGVYLEGEGALPPDIAVSPDSFDDTLFTGETSTHYLTISNVGDSELEFDIAIEEDALKLSSVDIVHIQEELAARRAEQMIEDTEGTLRSDNIALFGESSNEFSAITPKAGDSSILVIQDGPAWLVYMSDFIYDNFGITPTVINSGNIAITDFSSFDVIITVGNQSASYYSAISTNVAKFEEFVSNGGIVQYQLATMGGNVDIVGGVDVVFGNMEDENRVLLPSHPIVAGLPELLTGNYANHCYLSNLPPEAEIITETWYSGSPTTAVYSFGSGTVIATGMTWEFLYYYGYESGLMLYNSTAYSLSLIGPQWLTVGIESGVVPVGGSVDIPVTFDATDLPSDDYNANIQISSNDPDEPTVTVPAHLYVIDAMVSAISVDHVDGSPGPGMVNAGTDVVFHIRMTAGDNDIHGLTNGFRVYSPDGAEWNTTIADTTGAIGGAQFDLVWIINNFSITGSGADTVGFGGHVMIESGMPAGFDSVTHTITIGPIDPIYEGHTICLDSSYFPPAGTWMWTTSDVIIVYPTWDGPHCYTVVVDSVPPCISVTPDSLDEELYIDQSSIQTLTIENSCAGVLDYSIVIEPAIVAVADKSVNEHVTQTGVGRIGPVSSKSASTTDGEPVYDVTSASERQIPTIVPSLSRITETATGGAILWDLTHGIYLDYEPDGAFSSLVSLLGTMGFTVDTTSVGVNNIDLSQYDVLVVCIGSAWNSVYAPEEVSAIETFVNAGGGLLIMGDNPGCPNGNINPVSQSFGTTCGVSALYPQDLYISDLTAHPVFDGVSEIYFRAAGELTAISPSQLIAFDSSGLGAVATAEPGLGRVVVTGDVNLCNICMTAPNQLFAENAFTWLASTSSDYWLSVNTYSGSVPAFSSVDIDVIFDATGLSEGDYNADILISSNDPDNSLVTVPAHLYVHCCQIRGDVDHDGEIINISDLIYLIDYVFLEGAVPPCHEEADVNADCGEIIDISDLVYLIDYIFLGGPPPAECGDCTPPLAKLSNADPAASIKYVYEDGFTTVSIMSSVDLRGLQLELQGDGDTEPIKLVGDNLDMVSGQTGEIMKVGILDLDGGEFIPAGNHSLVRLAGTYNVTSALGADMGSYTLRLSVSMSTSSSDRPGTYALHQNYPNPFNPSTTINFSLPNATDVRLDIFNIMGQRVTTLVDQYLEAGNHSVIWDGSGFASGIYLYRLQSGNKVKSRKMVLMK